MSVQTGNRVSCLAWAQEYLNWDFDDWSHIPFSDESRFCYQLDYGKIRTWRKPGIQVNFGGGSSQFWRGINIGGRTEFFLMETSSISRQHSYSI